MTSQVHPDSALPSDPDYGAQFDTTEQQYASLASRTQSSESSSAAGSEQSRSADEFAINFIEQRAAQYLQDHADNEPGTGALVFEFGETGREYHSTLVELADDIRAALAKGDVLIKCDIPPAGWSCSRAPGHSGPCAATPSTQQAARWPVLRARPVAAAPAIGRQKNKETEK